MLKTIVTVTGASGSGKDTLVDAVLAISGKKDVNSLPDFVKRSIETLGVTKGSYVLRELISHTSRPKRVGEQEGIDYYFTTKEVIEKMPKIEYTEYVGNYYCLSEAEVQRLNGEIGIVIVDRHGVSCINEYAENKEDVRVFNVFVAVSEDISRERMLNRGDAAESVDKRCKQHRERDEYSAFKNDGTAYDCILNNFNDFAVALEKLHNFLQMLKD